MIGIEMDRGWVKDWRKDEDWRFHPLNRKRKFTEYEAWKDLIKMANHEERRIVFEGEYRFIQRGQFLTSQSKLAERWKWSKSSAHGFLKNLAKHLEIRTQTDRLSTTITICNYDKYQSTAKEADGNPRTPVERSPNANRNKQELKELGELKNIRAANKKNRRMRKDYGPPGIRQI